MKRIFLLVVALLSATILSAKGDLHLFDVDNKDGVITSNQIAKAFSDNGFGVVVNSNMNKPFKIQFKETSFKIYTLMTIYHKTLTPELVKKHPDAGVFAPMGVGIYQTKKEDTLHVSILTSDAQAKILGFDDVLLKKIEKEVLAVINKTLPNAKHSLSAEALKTDTSLVTKYELEMEDDLDETIENLMMSLNNGFELYGFVVPGKLNLNEAMKDGPYDYYRTISICKLPVIYTVSKTSPQAAAFAPCTLMIYKKKGEDKIILGFPAVHNWMSSANVQNNDATAILLKAQKQFEDILVEVIE